MNDREIILKCTDANLKYMRLPAGQVDGLEKLTALYKRLAKQSLECATAWVANNPCPSHEPAVDAFWWGVVAWADAFGLSVIAMGDQEEWGRVFISPHYEFAEYLKPLDRTLVIWERSYGSAPEPLPMVSGPPADIILRLDSLWMERVTKLTAKWGLMAHLKDKDALTEAQRLGLDLRNPLSPAYKAYLESDLKFLKALFPNFPFGQGIRKQLGDLIIKIEEKTNG